MQRVRFTLLPSRSAPAADPGARLRCVCEAAAYPSSCSDGASAPHYDTTPLTRPCDAPPCRVVGACHSGAICHVSSGKLAPPPPTHISISSPTRNRLAPQTQTQTHTRTHNRMPSVRSSRIPVAFETPIRHSIAATAPARSDRVECAMIRTAVLPLHRALIRSRSRAGPWRGA